MSVLICGLGTVTPPVSITQVRAAEVVSQLLPGTRRQQQMLAEVYRHVGIETRHSVILSAGTTSDVVGQDFYAPAAGPDDVGPSTGQRMQQYETHAGPLAVESARRTLDDAQTSPKDVTHIITVSCSGFYAPGLDVSLIDGLGLRRGVVRVHVGFMGCHGALNALGIARAFVLADPTACVLVTAVELCTLHHQYGWDRDQLVANSLFADSAASVVCRGQSSSDTCPRIAATGSVVLPDSLDLMSWRIRDHGFQMTLSGKVPAFIEEHLRPWLAEWLSKSGLEIENVGGWGIHPGGPAILQSSETALKLPPESLRHSRDVLNQFGNMSSPTILFILSRLRQTSPPFPWVLLGFGPGLSIEAVLLQKSA